MNDLNWKWKQGIKPSGRSMREIINSMHQSVIESNGRLYTQEEAVTLTDEIRTELRKKDTSNL